jgi:hypothetical protein
MYWRKFLNKLCDLVFKVQTGLDVWNLTQFEPFVVGICLPFSRHPPWRVRGTSLLDGMGRLLRGLPASKDGWGRAILQQFLEQSWSLESMQPSLVWDLLCTSG